MVHGVKYLKPAHSPSQSPTTCNLSHQTISLHEVLISGQPTQQQSRIAPLVIPSLNLEPVMSIPSPPTLDTPHTPRAARNKRKRRTSTLTPEPRYQKEEQRLAFANTGIPEKYFPFPAFVGGQPNPFSRENYPENFGDEAPAPPRRASITGSSSVAAPARLMSKIIEALRSAGKRASNHFTSPEGERRATTQARPERAVHGLKAV